MCILTLPLVASSYLEIDQALAHVGDLVATQEQWQISSQHIACKAKVPACQATKARRVELLHQKGIAIAILRNA